jgi:hypothetical protein
MTRYHISWKLNPNLIPADPEQRGKMWLRLMEKVKAELDAGRMADWGIAADLSGGYSIRESDEQALLLAINAFTPYIITDVKPVLSVHPALETVKKGMTVLKPG